MNKVKFNDYSLKEVDFVKNRNGNGLYIRQRYSLGSYENMREFQTLGKD